MKGSMDPNRKLNEQSYGEMRLTGSHVHINLSVTRITHTLLQQQFCEAKKDAKEQTSAKRGNQQLVSCILQNNGESLCSGSKQA